MTLKRIMVTRVIGMSTSVMAKALTMGWYIAAFWCRITIGRWANRAGISDTSNRAGMKTKLRRRSVIWSEIMCEDESHKKRTPPREK